MAHKLFLFNFLVLAFFFATCNSLEPPPPNGEKPTLNLELEDVSCIEAWIKLTTTNLTLPAELLLKQINPNGDTLSQILNLNTQDSLLYIDSLLPKQTYKFHTSIQASSHTEEVKSEELSVTTMDTTSHNFTWQTFTFGEHSSSVLYDVAIINENNIWAVGEIYLNDSTGQAYNAVHWDGNNWQLRRIYFPTVCASTDSTPYPAKSIFVFDNGEIWISSSGDKIAIIENGIQIEKFCLPSNVSMSINKIWGSSSNDVYVVGNAGNIAHYQNGSWSKIESGTDLPINDIWGSNYFGEAKVLAVASNIYQFQDKKILSISSSGVTEIFNDGLPWSLGSVWFSNNYKFYTGGGGLYVKYYEQNSWDRIPLPLYYIFSIRGNGLNDIILCGGLGYVGHFDGGSWINYLGNGLEEISGNYYSSAIKGNKICAVGIADGKAVALIGTR